ncbi:MAG: hypothetical protein A3C80_03895 [Candidatus Ryanbacteria bacterium RIFCSPHIGHO2_02_FULL_45_43]|uniref:Tyrosine specific protein phosphatases domain-containing protein n=1 Tax=Candidatus Ryanbacteria bacterium RIFCSPHIGHO2_01_45_13 TaxID=1802112 RepID=A0A1G2G139_9BACT|nr:MAG: hypothetical protein A2718_01315 [Candidatus Ryanbacteria bacterium RIFCSPHIGHO2_01_FULL_44_130]OGZ43541.1 MAG: hypothetical protein A2W41_04385 [Candidatus Ryanbacteria bacterium RIFCSPHIGHO2_01_45_13]OGZ47917.1 MAG: hypothetical protein A3C80_03895 [Candidatus Ryanbacteria bacterium RIFCSPHIGHO2_02_FULL_45_43]OGZ49930.1 MAG: hypothetical protein A3E55_03930 [Candidatus Ryanbacteria bacterium RIFCSPHIGHO2_12_FULL_44_20]OGZ51040.1 MAG: hypothetical protein A3A17_03470 [Candidatus Ryanba
MTNHSPTTILEYNYIDEGIYIDTNQCCKAHMDEMLLKKGITADISLETVRLDQPFGVTFYVWIPVENHTAPTHDQLDFGVSVLEKLVQMKRKVYVHCQNGHGRAPTLVAAYFTTKGMTPDKAEAFIKSKRPSIHLENVQRKALKEFAKS